MGTRRWLQLERFAELLGLVLRVRKQWRPATGSSCSGVEANTYYSHNAVVRLTYFVFSLGDKDIVNVFAFPMFFLCFWVAELKIYVFAKPDCRVSGCQSTVAGASDLGWLVCQSTVAGASDL